MALYTDGTDRTLISANNMDFLRGEIKTPRQMVEFLKEGALFRSFSYVLHQLAPEEDLAARLTEGLAEYTGEDHESIARKVRNWLKDKNVPKSRETLFQICFILGVGEGEASRILGTASETGIHYRNPEELVYAYGLRTHKSYEETVRLREQVSQLMKTIKTEQTDATPKSYTKQIREEFQQVDSDEDLFAFFRENGEKLGILHETACRKFTELLDKLQKPEGITGETEETYTMGEVAQLYLRMKVPQTKKVSGYSLLQRLVKKYWPNESSLLKMRNRREDVSRKALLLLYLITETFDSPDEEALEDDFYYWEDTEEEEDGDTRLEMRFEKMNLFLDQYGMNRLDYGNPFDLLVLYAMKTEEDDYAGERMQEVLGLLFDNEDD